MFERPSQAKEFKAKLERDRNDVSQVFVKSDANFRQMMVPDQLLGTFDLAMTKAGVTGERAQALREAYAGQLIMKGMRQASNTMKREYIAGASNEQARNLMMDFMSHTSRMGHLEHQGEINRTYFQAEKEARMLHQPGVGPNLDADGRPRPQASAAEVMVAQAGVAEMRRRMTSPDGDNSADQMGRGVRGLTTLSVLDALVRPAHLFMTLAGNHAFALSMLGGKHGAVAGTVALTKAYAQLGGTAARAAGRNAMAVIHRELKAENWMLSEVYRERLKKAGDIKPEHVDLLIDEFNRSNLINQTHMSEVRRMAGPDGWLGANGRFNYIARGLDIFGAGEHAIDSMSRVAVGKAAFVMELAKNGGDVSGALAYAKTIAEKSQPDWNFYNRPRLTTRQGGLGQFGSLVTQFKSFGMHAYGVQGNLIADAYRNASGSAERREALKSLALLHGSHALLWGGVGASVFGGVPMMAAMGMYDYMTGSDRPHTNREWETWSRNYVHDIAGKTIADVYQYGLPAAGGINTSASLRFSNIMGVPEIRTYDNAGYMEFGFKALTGAAGSTVAKMAETGTQILRGDTRWETFAGFLPRILEDPIKAGFWATGGMKDSKGTRTIVPAEQFSAWDIAAKGAGFNPSRVSTAQDARGIIDLTEKVRQDAQEPLLRNLMQTVASKRDTKGVIEEIRRFNDAVPVNERITGQQIQSRLKEQARINAMPGQFGMQVPRRQIGAVGEEVRFTRP
jgi:phage FluMu protein gp41